MGGVQEESRNGVQEERWREYKRKDGGSARGKMEVVQGETRKGREGGSKGERRTEHKGEEDGVGKNGKGVKGERG